MAIIMSSPNPFVIFYLFNKQLLPGLLVDSADYHPEKELFPEGIARGK